MHTMIAGAGLYLPHWLGNGLGLLYSTIEERENQISLGRIPESASFYFRSKSPVSLQHLLSKQGSTAEGDSDTSWALVHMLTLEPSYAPHFPKLLEIATRRRPTANDLESITGKSLDQIQKDLDVYARRSLLPALTINLPPQSPSTKLQSQPVAEDEFALVLAKSALALTTGKPAKLAVEAYISKFPGTVGAAELKAYSASLSDNPTNVRQALHDAILAGSTEPWLVLAFREFFANDKALTGLQIKSLQDCLRKYPDNLTVRMALAQLHLDLGRGIQALATLLAVKKIVPSKASALYLLRARAKASTGSLNAALADAKLAVEFARGVTEIDNATATEKWLRSSLESGLPSPPPQPELFQETRGHLLHHSCTDHTLLLKNRTGRELLLKVHPSGPLFVDGTAVAKLDLPCGPQKETQVRATFLPKLSPTGPSGVIRELFLP
ncbi:MAG: tetratricopeptide repeat protein [Bryobacter sp.]|nr:tetratricopeptide repeat protein [Bryobacter sp.]